MSVTVRDNTAKAKRKINDATVKSLKKIALDLAGQAAQRAPLELGDLRGSFSPDEGIDDTEVNQGRIRVGSYLPYALVQHENLSYHHDEGEAKYLERPALERLSMYKRMVGQSLRIEVNNA